MPRWAPMSTISSDFNETSMMSSFFSPKIGESIVQKPTRHRWGRERYPLDSVRQELTRPTLRDTSDHRRRLDRFPAAQ